MTISTLSGAVVFSLAALGFVPDSTIAAERSIAIAPATTVEITDRADDVDAVLAYFNERRAERRLPLLSLDARLCAIAHSHAVDMALRGYFGHTTPEGASPFDRMASAHYTFEIAGENLALEGSADAADDAWWHSPEHRRNMLEPHFARVGIAAVSEPEGELFVADFSN